VAEYCIVFVESDGWSYKEMEPVFDSLDEAQREALIRRASCGLPVLGVADHTAKRLVWRSDGATLEIPQKFQVWPTD